MTHRLKLLGVFLVAIAMSTIFVIFFGGSNKIDRRTVKIMVLLESESNNELPESRVAIYLDQDLFASAHIKLQPVDVMGGADLPNRRIMGNTPLIIVVDSSLLRRHSTLRVVDEVWNIHADVLTSYITDNRTSEIIFCRVAPIGSERRWGIATRSEGGYRVIDSK